MPNLLTGRHLSSSAISSSLDTEATLDRCSQVGEVHLIFPDRCAVISNNSVNLFLNLLHDMGELKAHDPEVVERG